MKNINLEDFIQVILGTIILATPIILTEEATTISQNIPIYKVGMLIFISFVLNSLFIFYGVYEGVVNSKLPKFIARIFINYFLTIFTVCAIIFLLNFNNHFENLKHFFNFIILVSFPSSLAGVVIDSFDKE